MKQKAFLLLCASIFSLSAIAQGNFFGIARNSTLSTETFLSQVNPATGVVTNISTSSLGGSINLTGAALDPYNNYYHYMSGASINTVSLTTGTVVNSILISNPIAYSYFDNFRFNNSDTSLYGLARRNIYDSVTMTSIGEVYLARINVSTGVITQISPSSVGYGFSLGGSAIDPYQKIYYYTTGNRLVGLDMYTGSIWSDVPMVITNGIIFDNLSYSCADTGIYGLIRQNYYDTLYLDPLDSTNTMVLVDSTSIFLGRVNPVTGVVSTISPYSIASGGYSLNAGSTIDPGNMLYYYSNGSQLVAVSLATGLITSQNSFTNVNGEHFELMRYMSNCIGVTLPSRFPSTTGLGNIGQVPAVNFYPNPVDNTLYISGCSAYHSLSIIDAVGKVVYNSEINTPNGAFDISSLPSGIYLAKLSGANGNIICKFSKM